ncbi:hypothetical protein AURDEDRAFT_112641, partial [Auricularia subglabra TFB-10046 SS5]
PLLLIAILPLIIVVASLIAPLRRLRRLRPLLCALALTLLLSRGNHILCDHRKLVSGYPGLPKPGKEFEAADARWV